MDPKSLRFDENRSLWLADKEPYVESAPLRRDLDVDVAIIGGGFTGISTAYHLSKRFPDIQIVLLEAKSLANGASGRNGGQMLNWVHGIDSDEPETARQIYEATREGIDTVLSIIAEHRLEVPCRRGGHLDVHVRARSADAAAALTDKLAAAGLPLRFLPKSELPSYVALEGAEGAVFDPEGGQIDGAALIRRLRPVLEARGVRIFESTLVTRIREGRTVELETPNATVRAAAIVLATNAYTPHLGYFRTGLVPLHSHVIGTEPLSQNDWMELGWKQADAFTDDRDRLSYGTLTMSGRLLFGGGSNAAYDYLYGNGTGFHGPTERSRAANHEQLLRYLPRLRDIRVTHHWSGPIALTLSRVCTMGVRGEHRNVYFALGYSGHGVTLANLAGKVLTDVYSGADERWRSLPFYQQDLRYVPPEPFRFVGYHVHTRLTGRSPRSR